MRKMIEDLCSLSGISGQEHPVRDYIIRSLQDAPAVENIRVDALGNCIVSLKGKNKATHSVVFAAHMDEVGGIVTGVTDDGFLRFDVVGGINNDALFAKTVTVNGHIGVIGGKAVHQCSESEKSSTPTKTNLLIDIGANGEEQARNIAREGDAVTFLSHGIALNETVVSTKALDDRAGCALLLKLAHSVPQYDVTLVFTVQEEIGTRGAATAAFALQPDISVIVDVTTASDIPGVPIEKHVTVLGNGPAVSFMDRGTMYDLDLYNAIRTMAEENDIPTQTKTLIAGGNDSRAFQCAGVGSRVAAVSLPGRYIHSPKTVYNSSDLENTYRLLELLANRLPAWELPV